ncbi:flagellar protein FlgN [Paenibacillus harenae]|uniref:flagellar protein FlgN n=1 Tax=Paenibacillus harenae TaxID=306543 RepID=UPI0004914EBF|nr:flagellar protein FlgN [Paenibacillus harenae]
MTVSKVIETMDSLTEMHKHLLQSGLEKKQAIISKDLDSLMRIMRLESKILKDITAMDMMRVAACRKLMLEKGVKNRINTTYRQLMGVVFVPEERIRLQEVHERLESVLKELKNLNDLNQDLLNQSLDFVHFSIDLLISPEDESYTYKHPSNQLRNSNRNGIYNSKA